MKKVYKEIEKLRQYFTTYQITIAKNKQPFREELFFVDLTINGKTWEILVDDEYHDFSKSNDLINLFLILNSLLLYEEAADYIAWCNQCGLDPAVTMFLEYYRSLASVYREIDEILGEIDACISSYDYSLRTGVMQSLADSKL